MGVYDIGDVDQDCPVVASSTVLHLCGACSIPLVHVRNNPDN